MDSITPLVNKTFYLRLFTVSSLIQKARCQLSGCVQYINTYSELGSLATRTRTMAKFMVIPTVHKTSTNVSTSWAISSILALWHHAPSAHADCEHWCTI